MFVDDGVMYRGFVKRNYQAGFRGALLLTAAAAESQPWRIDMVQRLSRQINNWETVLEQAEAHGVSALLQTVLLESGVLQELPLHIRRRFDTWRTVRRQRHLAITLQLQALIRVCLQEGIVPILLKGAGLAHTIYRHPEERSLADIDLLVHKRDVESVVRILASLGYQRQPLYYSDLFNATFGYHHLFLPSAAQGAHAVPVEVHWELASELERRHDLRAAIFWEDQQARGRQGDRLRCHQPSVPLQLVYSAVHLAAEGHAFNRLSGLADIARLCDRLSVDGWQRVLQLSRLTRSKTAVWLACTLATNLLGASPPIDVLQELRPSPIVMPILDHALNAATLTSERTPLRRSAVKYFVVDGTLTTAAVLCERIFPPPAALRLLRPEWCQPSLFLAYIRHAVTVLREARRHLFLWAH